MGKEPQANTVETAKGQMNPEAVWALQVCVHCQYSWAFTQRGVVFFFFHFFYVHSVRVCRGTCTWGCEADGGTLSQSAVFGSYAISISNISELQEHGLRILSSKALVMSGTL